MRLSSCWLSVNCARTTACEKTNGHLQSFGLELAQTEIYFPFFPAPTYILFVYGRKKRPEGWEICLFFFTAHYVLCMFDTAATLHTYRFPEELSKFDVGLLVVLFDDLPEGRVVEHRVLVQPDWSKATVWPWVCRVIGLYVKRQRNRRQVNLPHTNEHHRSLFFLKKSKERSHN
jgi:hypothetical protein